MNTVLLFVFAAACTGLAAAGWHGITRGEQNAGLYFVAAAIMAVLVAFSWRRVADDARKRRTDS